MKKLFAIVLALALGMTASALTLDNAETANEADTAVLAEETTESNAGKPGYNLWTGTTEAYTFDGDLVLSDYSTSGDINKNWAPAEDIYIDSTTESDNSSLHLKGDRRGFSVNSAFSIDAARPVTMNYRFKTAVTSAMYMSLRANKSGWWNTSGTTIYVWESSAYQVNLASGNTNGWTTQNKVITPANARNMTYDTAPETVTNFWFQLATNYSTPVYIDDVSLTPHYKITYDIGAGIGTAPADEYFLADSYTLKADTSTFTAPPDAEFGGWEDQFGRRFTTTVTPVLGEDLVLSAVWIAKYQINAPGINIWTGTTAPYDFEHNPTYGNEAAQEIDICWSNSYVDSTTEEDNISMVISGDHPNFTLRNVNATIDADRPITYKFRFKTETQNNFWLRFRPNSTGKYKMIDGVAKQCVAFLYNQNLAVANDGKWYNQTLTTTAESFSDLDVASIDTVNNIYFFAIQSNSSDKAWIDDVSIIPHYKVSYNLGEGTGETPADEYFLADSYTLQADISAITAPEGKVFAYWVDQNYNKHYDTVTPTVGEDLVLTAVYEDFKTLDIASMRLTTPQGIRVAAFVGEGIIPGAAEYGFIATTEAQLGDASAATLTFDNEELAKVSAAAYIKDTDTNLIYTSDKTEAQTLFGNQAVDADGVYFTGVYVNVPETAEAYQTMLVCRSYVKIGSSYFYGEPVSRSVYEVANAIKAKCEADGTEVPAGVTEAIAVVEGN